MSISNMAVVDEVKAVLFGVAVGDALGVPVEFRNRRDLWQNPVFDMIGHGTHNMPAGTFSDDASLTFCLAEALADGFDLEKIATNFLKWYRDDYWTPHGKLFDIGIATSRAIAEFGRGAPAHLAGGDAEEDNGNGSLMRISPLLFHIFEKPIGERFDITAGVSSITHRHIRSIMACFYYLEFARLLLKKHSKEEAYRNAQKTVSEYFLSHSMKNSEILLFDRILRKDIHELSEEEIFSSGYVVHTLEASMWCLMTTNSYEDAVLRAVNLGGDTDTTAAVTGGLAGLLYGYEGIPNKWIQQLARSGDIDDLAKRLGRTII